MNIQEMHVWFRQYAQQMGMQNVRAILPEQIDLLINSSITDTINQIITQNIGITNDRVITDNSKLGQINALRSLYNVILVNANPVSNTDEQNVANPFVRGEETQIFTIKADISKFDTDFKYLYLVDLAINYKTKENNGIIGGNLNSIITNYFPVRLIDDAYLADTINDFVLKPRLRTPVAVIYNNKLDIYIDDTVLTGLPNNLNPYKLRVSYIAKPAVVAYKQDLGGTNVDCDLPEYMHVDILKHAVDLYRISISGSLSAAQQQAQTQQQENVRNNARTDSANNYQS